MENRKIPEPDTMKKKVIAVGFSDFHTALWKQFNKNKERSGILTQAFSSILGASIKYDVPLLFSGDWNDHPKYMDNYIMGLTSEMMQEARSKNKTIIGINGNHDFYEKNYHKAQTRGYLHHLEAFGSPVTCIDFTFYDTGGFRVHGIPYINNNADFAVALGEAIDNRKKNRPNILLIHTDLPGAESPDGRITGTAENVDKSVKRGFANFDLVLAGHIHKHQKLGKNVYMIGAPYQQRRSDANNEMGYILIYDDFTIKQIPLNLPGFRFYTAGEEHEDTKDFWIELPKPIEVSGSTQPLKFDVKSDRGKLAKNFLRAKGIKNKNKLQLLTSYLNS